MSGSCLLTKYKAVRDGGRGAFRFSKALKLRSQFWLGPGFRAKPVENWVALLNHKQILFSPCTASFYAVGYKYNLGHWDGTVGGVPGFRHAKKSTPTLRL